MHCQLIGQGKHHGYSSCSNSATQTCPVHDPATAKFSMPSIDFHAYASLLSLQMLQLLDQDELLQSGCVTWHSWDSPGPVGSCHLCGLLHANLVASNTRQKGAHGHPSSTQSTSAPATFTLHHACLPERCRLLGL